MRPPHNNKATSHLKIMRLAQIIEATSQQLGNVTTMILPQTNKVIDVTAQQ